MNCALISTLLNNKIIDLYLVNNHKNISEHSELYTNYGANFDNKSRINDLHDQFLFNVISLYKSMRANRDILKDCVM